MAAIGTLFVIATPIGNLSDLSDRSKQVLAQVPTIAAEDTRQARKLLSHLNLKKQIIRCDELHEAQAAKQLLEVLHSNQDVAFLTDAGTPGIADPGAKLTQTAFENQVRVVPLPGPSAITTALSISGFRTVPFWFLGFLARKGSSRTHELHKIALGENTSVFFESPHRIQRTLMELAQLAPDRMAVVTRELTKKFEEIQRGTLEELAEHFSARKIQGEFTVVVAPQKRSKRSRVNRYPKSSEEK